MNFRKSDSDWKRSAEKIQARKKELVREIESVRLRKTPERSGRVERAMRSGEEEDDLRKKKKIKKIREKE